MPHDELVQGDHVMGMSTAAAGGWTSVFEGTGFWVGVRPSTCVVTCAVAFAWR